MKLKKLDFTNSNTVQFGEHVIVQIRQMNRRGMFDSWIGTITITYRDSEPLLIKTDPKTTKEEVVEGLESIMASIFLPVVDN